MSKKPETLYILPGKCRGRTKYDYDAAREAARLLQKEMFLCQECSSWHVSPPTLNTRPAGR